MIHSFSRTLFDVEQFDKKILLSKLVEYVCQNQIGSETPTNALRILSEFNDKNPTQMQNYALQLMVSKTFSYRSCKAKTLVSFISVFVR